TAFANRNRRGPSHSRRNNLVPGITCATRWRTGSFCLLASFLVPWLLATASVLALPSIANAHSASDRYGEAIIWFVVVKMIGVVAVVIALFFAIAWLVGVLGRAKV